MGCHRDQSWIPSIVSSRPLLPLLRPILQTSISCCFSEGAGVDLFIWVYFFFYQWVPNLPLLTPSFPQLKVKINIRRVKIIEEVKGKTPKIRSKSTRIQILASPLWARLPWASYLSEP